MPNTQSKEIRVAFEDILEGFQDALVLSSAVSIYKTDPKSIERSNNRIWRPMPYVSQSFAGTDMTANFKDSVQLSVPANINIARSSPWVLSAAELRDELVSGQLGKSAKQKIASDINLSVLAVASNQGTLVVKRPSAAAGFADVAQSDAMMNEIGVQQEGRQHAFSSRDYNGMADNLAQRTLYPKGRSEDAYSRAYVGNIASFDTYKLDYAQRLLARAGVTVTVNGANQFYVPRSTSTASTFETDNVDNRYQNINITVASGTVRVGDAFVFAGVNSCHLITKLDTGQPKTYRVIGIVSGGGGTGTITISPPIISGQGATDAELAYKNCTATPASGAAITFQNTADANINPFWLKDAIEILPGRYEVPTDAGAEVMRGSTDQGIELVMTKQFDINTWRTKFRIDALYGVVNKQPEMTGIMLFAQP